MKVAIIGTWHVHTEEYTRAILENPKAEAVAVWDSDAARGKRSPTRWACRSRRISTAS